jgi:hypothetical protein
MKRLGEINYVIQQRSTSAKIVTHVGKLKKYEGPEPDDWTVAHNTNLMPQTSSNHIETNDPAPQNDRQIRHRKQPAWMQDFALETMV